MSNIFAVSSLVSFPHFIFINNVSCTFPLPQVSFLLTLSSSYFLSCIIFWFVLARFSTFHYLFHFFFTFSDVLNFIFCVIFFYVLLLSILYICYLIFPTHISFLHPSCYVFSSSYCFSPIYFPPSTSTVFFATLHFYIFPYFLFLPLFHICFLPFFPFSHFLSFSPPLFCFLFSSPAFSQWRVNMRGDDGHAVWTPSIIRPLNAHSCHSVHQYVSQNIWVCSVSLTVCVRVYHFYNIYNISNSQKVTKNVNSNLTSAQHDSMHFAQTELFCFRVCVCVCVQIGECISCTLSDSEQ